MSAQSGTSRGFTLIEVLVAFLILAFSLGALFKLFSGSLRSVRQGEDYAHATALAHAQLARIDADGIDGQGIEWTREYLAVELERSSAGVWTVVRRRPVEP